MRFSRATSRDKVLATGNTGFTLGTSPTDEVLVPVADFSVVFTLGSATFGAAGEVVVAGVLSVV